jgi:hypothetical protein
VAAHEAKRSDFLQHPVKEARSFDSGSLLRRAVTASQRNNCRAQHLPSLRMTEFLSGVLSGLFQISLKE